MFSRWPRSDLNPGIVFLVEKATAPHSSTLAWKNPIDGGAWWGAVHGVAKSWTRLSDFTSLSCTGEGNGNPLHCSYLENPRDGGAWWAAIYGVAQSQTRLKRLSSDSSRVFLPGKFHGQSLRESDTTEHAHTHTHTHTHNMPTGGNK